MAEKRVGDVTIGVIFETRAAANAIRVITDALARIKGESAEDVAALRQLSTQLDNLEKESREAAGAAQKLGDEQEEQSRRTGRSVERMAQLSLAVEGVKRVYDVWSSTLGNLKQQYNELEASERALEGQSRISGQSLQFLKQTSDEAKDSFKLTTEQANQFTVEVSKLTAKAGEVDKTGNAIARLMDLGAARGLSTEATLTAIGQAILGIDEGTDKLFNKNPSAIYMEYADSIGTTAGKLSDQQKAQALLNAVIEDGLKVQGEYGKYLETDAGRTQQFRNATRELNQAFGAMIAGALSDVVPLLTSMVQRLADGPPLLQAFVAGVAALTGGLISLQVTGLLPLIREFFPGFLAGIRGISLSLTALAGPAGIVIAVVSALGYLALAHQEAGRAAREHAAREEELANIQNQIATETIGLSIGQVEKLLDAEKERKKEMESQFELQTSMFLMQKRAAEQQGSPFGPQAEQTIPGFGDVDEQKKNIEEIDARIAGLTQRIQFLKDAGKTDPGGGVTGMADAELAVVRQIADATVFEIIDMIDQTKKMITGLKELIRQPGDLSKETVSKMKEDLAGYERQLEILVRRREQLAAGIEIGVMPERPAMEAEPEKIDDTLVNDKMVKAVKVKVDDMTSYYRQAVSMTMDQIAAMLAGSKNDWQQYFNYLKQLFIKMALTQALVSLFPGAGALLGVTKIVSSAASLGSPAIAQSLGGLQSEIAGLRYDLNTNIKQGLNRQTIVNIDGQQFVKQTIEPGLRTRNQMRF